ncbi:tail fiber assembly protein [Escherichia coli]|nr:tail fiber assembly protein [Escherichia coli]
MYLFSAKTLAFYPEQMKEIYKEAGSLPDDVIEVDDDTRNTFNGQPPENKILGTNNQGMPSWVDIPPPTQEELVAAADAEKQKRIDSANDYMNSKQWPGKAAIGRLKGDELAQYNLWLDYLDALETIDTNGAPDIKWPTSPASVEG